MQKDYSAIAPHNMHQGILQEENKSGMQFF